MVNIEKKRVDISEVIEQNEIVDKVNVILVIEVFEVKEY